MLYVNQLATNEFVNPDLKSEKTIDYEFGFQQKLNNKSSIKLSAFYREQRDMVQLIYLTGAYPINMKTYGNIDFGTVKGFGLTYDLRRTNNIQLKASYTLQFANATGSNSTTARSLIAAGQPNLRATLPTDFDQRHNFSILVDYRFSSGKNYDGPKWFGMDILADAGCNFTINTGAGTPYTPQDVETGKILPRGVSLDSDRVKAIISNIMHYINESDYKDASKFISIPEEYDFKKILNW